jgi:PhnB protein
MNQLNPYLFFNGNCAEAMRFYEKTLGGKLELMTNGQMPGADKAPKADPNLIMHARLTLDGGAVLMASDWMSDAPWHGASGFAVSLALQKVPDGQRIFESLSKGGKVTMPFGKTFWAEGFGMAIDRFGTQWMINAGHSVERPVEDYVAAAH